jgi:hypothetical protein
MPERFMTTRRQAIEDLSMCGIKRPQAYLAGIILLVEMMWADGEVQEGELAILDEYLHGGVRQINELGWRCRNRLPGCAGICASIYWDE